MKGKEEKKEKKEKMKKDEKEEKGEKGKEDHFHAPQENLSVIHSSIFSCGW